MKNKIKVVVVIPSYNVEKHILNVIKSLPDFISNIIIVNDCSTDRTLEIIHSDQDKRISIINHNKNKGVGGAVISGYRKAIELGGKVVVKVDGDGQMDPSYINNLILPIIERKADYCKGNRFLKSTELYKMPVIRRLGNIGLSFLTKAASGYWNIFDPTNGYTAISIEALGLINFNNLSNRYFFETSMLIELGLNGIVIKDINIPAYYGNEKSYLSEKKALGEFPPKLLRSFVKRILVNYFIKDFNVCSLFLSFGLIIFLFGTIFGIVVWRQSIISGITATTGTIMLSVLPIIIGFQLLLQALVLDIQNVPSEVITNPSKTFFS